ncbi:MAG: hypothetical protein QF365_03945 [Candidatus Thalassarchaeaceae archaeon]|jgi:hypothetical protein|nr:hypothetical protein [Candidatus Thalassarchaeaceae archaeon]MDP6149106.1 hypothetical protein [Candidatus Thalassarchaeaceae archaeon]MDP6317995.1 hypothetical protein [Candidatus Thalassarchaeaceae archaeon]HJM29891.1 hypothetical protein [Candidatus Thalassarchaeaceae archaeon]HJN70120.1 hypothetical protein [Candidatus Thalassarchaeaceae archaeon]|tara:strand:- start:4667 stop:5053 length:387 start_codon:yes stop_codon:yes gene_type:complete
MSSTFDQLDVVSIDFLFLGIIVGGLFVAYWSLVHLLVTWNPYHRPIMPVVMSLLILSIPVLMLIIESLSNPSELNLGQVLELLFMLLGMGVFTLLAFTPLIFLFVTIQMLKITFESKPDDPLMAMLED